MDQAGHTLRVVKKIQPGQPGAIKLARKHGEALLCVRYRHDSQGRFRYTTVELVVERTPIQRRADRLVDVKIAFKEKARRASALASGATWNPTTRLWCMPQHVAKRLGLAPHA